MKTLKDYAYINKEDVKQWLANPTTTYMMLVIEEEIELLKQSIADGSCMSKTSDQTASKYSMRIGQIESLGKILSMNFQRMHQIGLHSADTVEDLSKID